MTESFHRRPPKLNVLQRLMLWFVWRPWVLGRWWDAFADEMWLRGYGAGHKDGLFVRPSKAQRFKKHCKTRGRKRRKH